MSSFIQLDDINGTPRLVNVKKIAFIEPKGDNCRIALTIRGRGEYPNYAFVCRQTYDLVMRLIMDSDV